MRKPGGYAISYGLWGDKHEWDTFTCCHCNVVVKVMPKCNPDDLGGMCRLCMKMVCPKCVDTGICDPIEKKLERLEARDRALRSYGI
jgi:hypothetical protein